MKGSTGCERRRPSTKSPSKLDPYGPGNNIAYFLLADALVQVERLEECGRLPGEMREGPSGRRGGVGPVGSRLRQDGGLDEGRGGRGEGCCHQSPGAALAPVSRKRFAPIACRSKAVSLLPAAKPAARSNLPEMPVATFPPAARPVGRPLSYRPTPPASLLSLQR